MKVRNLGKEIGKGAESKNGYISKVTGKVILREKK